MATPQAEAETETETEVKTEESKATAESAEATPTTLPNEPVISLQELWATAQAHEHPEIWGVTLADPSTHIPSQIVLQKYLNANDGDIAKARDQLTKTLDWRKKTQPLELIKKTFSKEKFGGLGYVTVYSADNQEGGSNKAAKEIFTWNVYGNVKSIDVTFGQLDE
jgi:phosphatidylinositol transfer protein SFH5